MAHSKFARGSVNEDATHRLGGCGKEVPAAIPLLVFIASDSEPGFVDKGGWLQRIAWRFIGHFGGSELAEFGINQRKQFIGGLKVSRLEGAGHVAHATVCPEFRFCRERQVFAAIPLLRRVASFPRKVEPGLEALP